MNKEKRKIAVGCDGAGYELKLSVMSCLVESGFSVVDCGADSDAAVDYPVYARRVCELVAGGGCELGVLVCGTGIGMSIAANKYNGIRAACCSDTFSARLTREHNNANVLCIGSRVLGEGLALDIVGIFTGAAYTGEARHVRRLSMISDIEREQRS